MFARKPQNGDMLEYDDIRLAVYLPLYPPRLPTGDGVFILIDRQTKAYM